MTTAHIHLEAHGTALVLEQRAHGLPAVLHWGAPLGPASPDDLRALSEALSRQSPAGTLDAAWQVPIARRGSRRHG